MTCAPTNFIVRAAGLAGKANGQREGECRSATAPNRRREQSISCRIEDEDDECYRMMDAYTP